MREKGDMRFRAWVWCCDKRSYWMRMLRSLEGSMKSFIAYGQHGFYSDMWICANLLRHIQWIITWKVIRHNVNRRKGGNDIRRWTERNWAHVTVGCANSKGPPSVPNSELQDFRKCNISNITIRECTLIAYASHCTTYWTTVLSDLKGPTAI